MKIAKALGIILLLVMLSASAGQCWEFVDDDEGWCGGFSNNLTCSWLGPPHGWGGHLWLQPTGVDPYLVGPVGYNDKMFSAKACRYICLRMLVGFSSHATSEFFWRKGGTWYGRQFALTNTDGTQWVNYDLNMTQSPDWSGDISQIRLDPISPGHAGASILYDYVRPMYALDGSAYWGFDSDIEGWFATGNVGSYRAEGGYLKGTSTTADPYIYNYPGPTIDASYNNCIRVRMKTNAGTSAELYWAPWSYGYRSFPITSDNTFREYVLNMASTASWTGVTTYLRFDPSTANGCSFEIDYIQVFRDKVAPTGSVKINNDAPYTSGTSVTLNLSASDPDISQDHPIKKGSGVWQARYRNSGGSWGSWEAYTTSKAWTLPGGDGTKTVYAEFRDIAENVSSTYSDSIVLDTTPPNNPSSASETGGAANNVWQKNVSSPVFTWSGASDSHSGVKGYYWYFGTNASGNPTNWTTSAGCSPGAQSSGTYYLRVKTEDNVGNQSGVTTLFTFKYDGTAPTNAGSASETGGAANNTWQKNVSSPVFTWSGAGDSHSGVKGYYWYFGTNASGNPTNWTTSAGCSPGAQSSGTYYLRVKTEDNAGNQSGVTTLFTFKYDGTAPTNANSASETGGAANNVWQKNVSSPVFTWSGAGDSHSGVKGYYWYFGTNASGNPTNWTTSAGCSPGAQSSGTYYLRVKTEDNVGNQSGVSTLFTFKYDGTSPSTPVVIDDGDYITSKTEIHASWSAADAESGIAEYQYAISTTQSEVGIISGGGWQSVGTAENATRTGLSLNAGMTYYVLVKAKNGAGSWSAIGVSDGVTVCEAPSITTHPVSQTKLEGESVMFSVVAAGTAPLSYQWRKGGVDIDDANSASYTIDILATTDSGSYDCVVTNNCGFDISDAATLTVNALVIQAIGDAKKEADGSDVVISGKVTAIFTGFFYVQDDSTAGIRVAPAVMPEGLQLGDSVVISGTISTTQEAERVIVPTSINVSTGAAVDPVSLTNKDLGGGDFFYDSDTGAGQKGVEDGVGVNNIGLLVKTCGTVTSRGDDHFYIDDGTHARDFSLFNGIRVRCDGLTLPSSGDFICVSGISSILKVNGRVFRSIKPRVNGDIQLMSP